MTDLFAADAPAIVGALEDDVVDCDVAIIGSGMGGSTTAWALRQSGSRVLVVERGDFLPREDENWSASEVFLHARYRNAEPWIDESTGKTFEPGVHYYVGGNTKVYGACLPRFREEDFGRIEHQEGVSPAWPIDYADIEPYYGEAERLYVVHGSGADDPTEPWRSSAYPFPALPHEPEVQQFATSLRDQGLQPFSMPSGVDLRDGGRCIRCRTCDGFPCKLDAKADADVFGMRPALEDGNVRLLTRTVCERLESSPDGRAVTEALLVRDGRRVRLRAERFVVACGAVNSASLLLRSGTDRHQQGLANSSGQVGRNYMVHNSTFFMGVDPRRRNGVSFQKTLGMNDWYLRGPDSRFPLGNVQMLGKLQAPMIKGVKRWLPMGIADYIASHSIDVYLTTEDLPDPANFITVDRNGQIRVNWKPNNLKPHRTLVQAMKKAVRRAGYPVILTKRMDIATNSHQCGTAVMGHDPQRSVLNADCRTHDVDNLWVIDSACFPSSAAVNPALTIAANALRVVDKGGVAA